MKHFLIPVLFVCIACYAFAQDTTSIYAPKKMQDREKTDCWKFRRMEGRDRYDQFKKVLHLFPSAKLVENTNHKMEVKQGSITFYMSEKELTELLGKAISDHGKLVYNLAPEHCTAQFSKTKDGWIYFIGLSACQDKEAVEKN